MAKKPKKTAKAPPKSAPKTQEFVLHRGDGNKVFTGFDPAKDRFTFVYGSYSEIMFDAPVYDGMTFANADRTATWHVRADGADTHITVDADTARLVGVTPEQLHGRNFRGG